MTAKEMFKELGYKCGSIKTPLEYIEYEKKEKDYKVYISFSKKTIYVRGERQLNRPFPIVFDTRELKAINKQVEELGWNNE